MANAKKKKAADTAQSRTVKKKSAFLAAYAIRWRIGQAAVSAGVGRRTVYEWLEQDPDFKAAFDESRLSNVEAMEEEATRRAVQGVQRLKFHKGELVMIPDPSGAMVPDMQAKMVLKDGKWVLPMTPVMIPYVEHEFSDTLLMFRLNAEAPEKYRQNVKTEHSGKIGVDVRGENSPMPTREEVLERIAELTAKMNATGKPKG